MPAAYDNYNYPSYWEGREYEHKAEIIALRQLLKRIPHIEKIADIGSGYGRIAPEYSYRAKKIIFVDPSAKLLSMARKCYKDKKYKFIQSSIENLSGKIKSKSVDLVILIRVIHHFKDLPKAFKVVNKITKNNAYFILEFPNKRHIKATLIQFIKGNILYPLEIFPKDISSKKSIRKRSLPFVNYHPDYIKEQLQKSGFKILKTLSVSNLRYFLFKKNMPLEFSLFLEKHLQWILSFVNFGPSIFILAKKVTK
jgi:ubiquinone/menaquinone biosynthesis C-methylase UbiE